MPDIHDPIIILQALVTAWMRNPVGMFDLSAWLIKAHRYLDMHGLAPDIREVLREGE